MEAVFKTLQEKHGENFDTPRLRLWSRMISSGLHESEDDPPAIPAFSGVLPKRPRRESLSEALVGAATAFADSLKGGSGKAADPPKQHSTAVSMSVSPSKAVELRMKNLEQLRYLQQLHEDGILTDAELAELKRDIFSSLRKL